MKSSHSLRELSQNSILISFLLLRPALIHVIPVLALRAAELIARMVGDKDLRTVFAQPEGILVVRQHEAEHHLNAEKQGMEVPYDRRLVIEGDVIARRVPVLKSILYDGLLASHSPLDSDSGLTNSPE